jgi:uncharacterized radical SAM superfamily Fe-S cluster-containing enzyme
MNSRKLAEIKAIYEAKEAIGESEFRKGIVFNPSLKGLPINIESQCLECTRILEGRIFAREEQVILDKTCPDHGHFEEALNDAIYSGGVASDRKYSPIRTRSGVMINPVVRYLPKTVESLCPECGRNIAGRVFDWQGDVYMEKTCPDHGYWKDRVMTNTKLYLKMQKWSFREGAGLENPHILDAEHCPSQCGICNIHQSHTLLGQIDLTNRCNLSCPICFANANVTGMVYEPEYDEIVRLMENLRNYRPTPASTIQFTGGEPTIHKDFLRIVRKANEFGFSHVQIASNGIKLADPDFTMACGEAGLHTVYLQFDGVDDRIYESTRGRKLFDIKQKAVENIHRAGMKICLVPTIVRGVNDDQVPKILRFAIDNIHVVSAIAYQPVSFTGRISTEDRGAQRYTLGDLANDLATTGLIDVDRDFYPLSFVAPISRFLAAISGDPKITATAHPSCSAGTYLVVDENKNAVPVTKIFDVEGLFTEMEELSEKIGKSPFRFLNNLKMTQLFGKYYRPEEAPESMSVKRFLHALKGMTDKRTGRGKEGEKTYRTLMTAAMHFQDRYNYDIERVKRCVIHYSTPEGIYPFCSYNSGPIHRERVEKKHSVPMKEWKAKRASGPVTSGE